MHFSHSGVVKVYLSQAVLTVSRAVTPEFVVIFRFNRTPKTIRRGVKLRAVVIPSVFVQEGKHAGATKCISFNGVKFYGEIKRIERTFSVRIRVPPLIMVIA